VCFLLLPAFAYGSLVIADGCAISCLGQDNPSDSCIVGDVKNIFEGDLGDHDGPYAGITTEC
jgi:hypothetical protein